MCHSYLELQLQRLDEKTPRLGSCLLFNFTQFVILEILSILDMALSGVKGLRGKEIISTPRKIRIKENHC